MGHFALGRDIGTVALTGRITKLEFWVLSDQRKFSTASENQIPSIINPFIADVPVFSFEGISETAVIRQIGFFFLIQETAYQVSVEGVRYWRSYFTDYSGFERPFIG